MSTENLENNSYARLAARFGLMGASTPNSNTSQIATNQDISNTQNLINNTRESINTLNIQEEDHDHEAELALFKNVVNDPRFTKINQVPHNLSDAELLRLFPNIKSVIDKDPSKEATYLTNLNALSNSLQIKESNSELSRTDSSNSLNSRSSPADTATKKMVAASFLNMVGNNQDLVNTLIQKGPKVFLGDISGSGSGGWFTTENNMVLPKMGSRIGNETVDLASFAKVATHELGHWVDSTDGNIDGRNALLGSQFNNARTAVYQGIYRGTFDHLNDHYEQYAMTNPQEFFAVMGQFYANNPIAMQNDMPEMYRLFANAYNMDTTGTLTPGSNTLIAQNTRANNSAINSSTASSRITSNQAQVRAQTQSNTATNQATSTATRTAAYDRRYGSRTLVNNTRNTSGQANAMSAIARNRLA